MVHDQKHEQEILHRLKNPDIARVVASFEDVLKEIPTVSFHRLHDEILTFLEDVNNLPNQELAESELYRLACEHLRLRQHIVGRVIVPFVASGGAATRVNVYMGKRGGTLTRAR